MSGCSIMTICSMLPRRLTAADLELVDVARDKQFVRLSYRVRR
jgi:hypothetical protein